MQIELLLKKVCDSEPNNMTEGVKKLLKEMMITRLRLNLFAAHFHLVLSFGPCKLGYTLILFAICLLVELFMAPFLTSGFGSVVVVIAY